MKTSQFTAAALLLWLALVPVSIAAAPAAADAPEKPATPALEAALKTAAARKTPVLVDFHAPWCYSCYYMARHVLVGPEWEKVEHRTVVLELDADSPEGAYWKTLWGVKALPSYVVLDAKGAELGRILAEQTQADFYSKVNAILDRASTVDDLKAAAAKGGPGGLASAREALLLYHARYDGSAGLAWYQGLPAAARKAYDTDAAVQLALARLELLRAAQAQDAAACAAVGPKVLAGDLGCERPYELDRYAACTESLPAAQRQAALSAQLPAMQKLAEQQFAGKGAVCADERSVVLGLYDTYEALSRKAEGEAVVRRAAARLQQRSAELASDRNLADNWRVFLEVLEDHAALDALYPRLIAAYPDDYVYPFRYGRNLLARGDAARALPYLEQAAPKAYGQNRLKVAEQRVKALKALQRDAEAKKVVAEALKANGPWFPEDAARLKALL